VSPLTIWLITSFFFVFGLLGIFIPMLPGVLFIFGGILFYAIATGFTAISPVWVLTAGGILALAWLAEYAGSVAGVKIGGGGVRATAGMALGAALGLIGGGPPGLIAGAFLGALGGALYEGKSPARASKAAWWSVAGIIGGKIVQLLLALCVIAAFLLTVLS
jgi:uncharacterized protein